MEKKSCVDEKAVVVQNESVVLGKIAECSLEDLYGWREFLELIISASESAPGVSGGDDFGLDKLKVPCPHLTLDLVSAEIMRREGFLEVGVAYV